MDKAMKERIKRQLSLKEMKKIGDWSKVTNAHDNVWGDASNVSGNLSGIRGDLTNISGDLSGIWGNLSNISGNVKDIIAVLKEE